MKYKYQMPWNFEVNNGKVATEHSSLNTSIDHLQFQQMSIVYVISN